MGSHQIPLFRKVAIAIKNAIERAFRVGLRVRPPGEAETVGDLLRELDTHAVSGRRLWVVCHE
jgi:hypothetical protein